MTTTGKVAIGGGVVLTGFLIWWFLIRKKKPVTPAQTAQATPVKLTGAGSVVKPVSVGTGAAAGSNM